ncbi:MAG TPA: AMP-binding protein [Trueperaceae bacterium]
MRPRRAAAALRPLRAALWRGRLAASGALARLAEAEAWLAASPEDVEREQRSRLAALLRHAWAKVPYYREALADAGVVVAGPGGAPEVRLERFTALPPLSKRDLRERFADLTSADSVERGAYATATGGSTGEPVRFLHDRGMQAWKVANKALFDSWTGFRPGEPFALLWGAVGDLADAGLRARVGMWLRDELRLEAYQLTPALMDDYVARLNAFRPRLLLAYAQSAYQLARHAEERGLALEPIPAVMTSATNLEPEMRSTIERVFGARVYDRYGSREVGDVACENGDGRGLVVNPLTHVVEAVDEAGRPVPPGQQGELLVTALANLSMPLIRYRIGDAGALGEAGAGGVPWPRLAAIGGRVTDVFHTRDGRQVYGGYFTRQFYSRDWVSQFQVVQEDYDRLRVRLVPRPGTDAALVEVEKRALADSFRRAMGEGCAVEFEVVDDIPVGPTGKRRYTVSRVGPPA